MNFHINYFLVIITGIKTLYANSVFFITFFCIMALTEKQEAFCQFYIELGNKSQAYRQSYDAGAMNSNTVHVKACELFKNGNIRVRIEELQEEVRERNKVKIDDVLGYLADMIKFDIAEIYEEDGRMKSIHDIPKPHREMISSIKVYEDFISIDGQKEKVGETKEVKLLNKLDVIEKFMRHLGAYEKDNSQKKTELKAVIKVGYGKKEDGN